MSETFPSFTPDFDELAYLNSGDQGGLDGDLDSNEINKGNAPFVGGEL